MDLTPEQGAELWETWNLGGLFFGRALLDETSEAGTDEMEVEGPVMPDYTIGQIAALLELPPLQPRD